MREIGFTSWFSRDTPLEVAIGHLAAVNCKETELAAMPEYLTRSREIRALLRKHGMKATAVSLGVPFYYDSRLDLHSPAESVRGDSVSYACRSVDFASHIGADLVYACSIRRGPEDERADSLRRLDRSIRECAHYAEGLGIRFALEPFPTGVLPTVNDTVGFVKDIEADNLGLLLDTGHAAISGEPLAVAARISRGKTIHVHLNNNDGVGDLHWPPQRGKLQASDFAKFMAELNNQGYAGRVSLEISKAEPVEDTLVSSRLFVEQILDRI